MTQPLWNKPYASALAFGLTALLGLTLAHSETLPLKNQFLADPSAHVFEGQLYLYATNDNGNDGRYWNSRDWRALSSKDGIDWSDHGAVFDVSGFAWAKGLAWAPTAASRDGRFYLYLPVDRDKIGVAVAKTPIGPFKDALGAPLIDKARDANVGDEPIDPAVFSARDGQTYLYFGARVPKVVRLAPDMIHLAGPIENLKIIDAPITYGEAPWVHEHDGVYYFSYSTGWPGQIAYATSDTPTGPFHYRGVLLDFVNVDTNHQAIVDFQGQTLVFYHRNALPGGGAYKRSIVSQVLSYRPDGSVRPILRQAAPPARQ